jgi:hypothetical protein
MTTTPTCSICNQLDCSSVLNHYDLDDLLASNPFTTWAFEDNLEPEHDPRPTEDHTSPLYQG